MSLLMLALTLWLLLRQPWPRYADGDTCGELAAQGVKISAVLQDNDAYNALLKTGGLIFTGPTGTNVNDVAVALLR